MPTPPRSSHLVENQENQQQQQQPPNTAQHVKVQHFLLVYKINLHDDLRGTRGGACRKRPTPLRTCPVNQPLPLGLHLSSLGCGPGPLSTIAPPAATKVSRPSRHHDLPEALRSLPLVPGENARMSAQDAKPSRTWLLLTFLATLLFSGSGPPAVKPASPTPSAPGLPWPPLVERLPCTLCLWGGHSLAELPSS